MNQKLESVLSAEQWRTLASHAGIRIEELSRPRSLSYSHDLDDDGRGVAVGDEQGAHGLFRASSVRQLIAVANSALPDSDPRKITRERVQRVRDFLKTSAEGQSADISIANERPWAKQFRDDMDFARTLLDALESYLPPDAK
jgi:hypothetical protein